MASFAFEMLDKLSGPARAADSALKALEGELKATDDALKQLVRDQNLLKLNKLGGLNLGKDQQAAAKASMGALQAERIRLSMTRSLQRDETSAAAQVARAARATESREMRTLMTSQRATEKRALADAMAESKAMFKARAASAKSALDEVRKSAKKTEDGIKGMGIVATAALISIASHALNAAETLGRATIGFIASTAQAADYGQAQRRLLTGQYGQAEGARQYEILIEYSNRFGTSLHDTMSQFQTLTRSGFNQSQSIAMMQQFGDAATIMGADAANGMVLAIRQIVDNTKQSKEELNQLSERGVNIQKVYQNIALARHVTAARAQEMFKKGDISKAEEIAAIMKTLNQDFSQGGLAGTALTSRVTNTLGGKLDLITSRWEIFKTRVGDTEAFKPLVDFLGRVADMMDGNTESGKRFQAQLDNMFKGLFGDLKTIDPVELFKKLGDALNGVGTIARASIAVLIPLAKVILSIAEFIDQMRPGAGISMSAEDRAVRGAGLSNIEKLMVAQGQEIAPGDGVPVGDRQRVIAPSAIAPLPTQQQRARPNVTVGDVHVSINASDMDTAGMTPHEVGRAIGGGVTEQLYSDLSNAAASQGNPT